MIFKLIPKTLYGRMLTGFISLVIGASCCEHGIDALGSIKWRELND